MTGRPSTFSQGAADEIVDRVSSGEPLAQVCRDAHLPALSTFRDWMRKDDALSVRFADARDDGFDVIAADCLAIVDGGADDPQLAKVRAEIRLKLLAKWDAKRYGDVQQLRLAGNEGQNLRDISDTEAAARVAAILEAARRRAVPVLEEGSQSEADSHPSMNRLALSMAQAA